MYIRPAGNISTHYVSTYNHVLVHKRVRGGGHREHGLDHVSGMLDLWRKVCIYSHLLAFNANTTSSIYMGGLAAEVVVAVTL